MASKGFVVPVLRLKKRVPEGDVELVVFDVVQEHVDAAQIVGSRVAFLPEKALSHLVPAENLGELEQQGTRTAGRIIDLVDLGSATSVMRVRSSDTSCGV